MFSTRTNVTLMMMCVLRRFSTTRPLAPGAVRSAVREKGKENDRETPGAAIWKQTSNKLDTAAGDIWRD